MKTRIKTFSYFILLFAVVALVILPTFCNPPHVDYWEAFFVFHQVRADPDLSVWPYVVNHDPWRHGTFRPLSYSTLYLEHVFFGSRFILNHIANLGGYCLLLILLFYLGLRLGARRYEMGAFLAVFAVLYSHCDILSLTFHIFIIAGFAGFIGGFLLYLRYLERGGFYLLGGVAILFLLSMLSYETFALWPPAVFILLIGYSPPGKRKSRFIPTVSFLAILYFLYLLIFYLTRTSSHLSGELSLPSVSSFLFGIVLALFNLLYTQIGVNLWPPLAFPGRYRGYSEMLGNFPMHDPSWLSPAAFAAAGAVLILLILIGSILIRKGKRTAFVAFLFLVYLYLMNFSVLVAARSITSELSHILRQFRYQLIPNALIIMLVSLLLSSLLQSSRKKRTILILILIPVFLINLYFTRRHVNVVSSRLTPLRELLGEIRRGIRKGDINSNRTLYLGDGFATSFPRLCWNRGMGRRIWGTYQWIFSPEELRSFSRKEENAFWTIDFEEGFYRRNEKNRKN